MQKLAIVGCVIAKIKQMTNHLSSHLDHKLEYIHSSRYCIQSLAVWIENDVSVVAFK